MKITQEEHEKEMLEKGFRAIVRRVKNTGYCATTIFSNGERYTYHFDGSMSLAQCYDLNQLAKCKLNHTYKIIIGEDLTEEQRTHRMGLCVEELDILNQGHVQVKGDEKTSQEYKKTIQNPETFCVLYRPGGKGNPQPCYVFNNGKVLIGEKWYDGSVEVEHLHPLMDDKFYYLKPTESAKKLLPVLTHPGEKFYDVTFECVHSMGTWDKHAFKGVSEEDLTFLNTKLAMMGDIVPEGVLKRRADKRRRGE